MLAMLFRYYYAERAMLLSLLRWRLLLDTAMLNFNRDSVFRQPALIHPDRRAVQRTPSYAYRGKDTERVQVKVKRAERTAEQTL